jgi:propionyl-CoA synthetase
MVPYKPLLDKALEITDHSVECVVMKQRSNVEECQLGPLDVDFDELVSRAKPTEAIPVPSTHPHYILYTSGTTGLPKGVVRDTGGWAVSLKYSMDHFYGMRPGDVFWAASDIGWVVGHAYIVYAPLLHGCTAVLYEGKPVGTPDAGAFWRVIEEHKVKAMFTAPTAFRAIKQADPNAEFPKKYDLSSMESLFLAGEHSDPETIHWCERALPDIPAPIDHWWQTELGWPAVGNAVGLGRVPPRYGSCSMPVPGFALDFFDEEGNSVPANTLGNMVIKTPLPPGTLTTIFNQDERYFKDYLSKYPGYYDTGDSAYIDDDGYVYIMGRTDDVINTAGHRLSTGSMEEILMEHPNVADCAVIPVNDTIKGQVPVGFVVCNAATEEADHDRIRKELIKLVREELGPVAAFKKVGIVKALPKTRSGKTLRGTMSKIANGEDFKITPTIEDPTVFDHLTPAIKKLVSV